MQTASTDPLDTVAEAILSRKLQVPAIFLLELCKPLVGCMRELYGVGEPIACALLGSERAPALREVLSSSDSVEELIKRLEQPRENAAPTAEQSVAR